MHLQNGFTRSASRSLTAGHGVSIPALMDGMDRHLPHRLPVFLGGVIPDSDQLELRRLGVADIFGPGSPSSISR